MLAKHYVAALTIAVLVLSSSALAQKADAAFVVGGSFVSNTSVNAVPICPGPVCPTFSTNVQSTHQVFLEGTLAARLLNAKVASLHLELPVAGIPSQKLTFTSAPTGLVGHLSSVFFTPALRLKLLPGSPIAPWVSVGGGLAHYSPDSGSSTSKGALEYGGGLDFKTGIPHLGFRAEVRDFVSGAPSLPVVNGFVVTTQGGSHHNVLAGGGIVLRF
jgi:hypothetical protein